MVAIRNIGREFRSLVYRRRLQMTYLASAYAALSYSLQSALHGGLPRQFGKLEGHLFAVHAGLLAILGIIMALREARLHGGMMLNGSLYWGLLGQQGMIAPPSTTIFSAPHMFGVSGVMLAIAGSIASGSLCVCALAVGIPLWVAVVSAGAVLMVLGWIQRRSEREAVDRARRQLQTETLEGFSVEEWHDHVLGSLDDVNQDMLTLIVLASLTTFAGLQNIAALGNMPAEMRSEFDVVALMAYAPIVYSGLMLVTVLLCVMGYLRLRIAMGDLSLQLDPWDTPFRAGHMTDSLLGYMLLSLLLSVAAYTMIRSTSSTCGEWIAWSAALTIGLLTIGAEQMLLIVCNARRRSRPDSSREKV